jgi:hypothetical protein
MASSLPAASATATRAGQSAKFNVFKATSDDPCLETVVVAHERRVQLICTPTRPSAHSIRHAPLYLSCKSVASEGRRTSNVVSYSHGKGKSSSVSWGRMLPVAAATGAHAANLCEFRHGLTRHCTAL